MRQSAIRVALALVTCLARGCSSPPPVRPDRTAPYLYEDTRRLVAFVERAAAAVEAKGPTAFADFTRDHAGWNPGEPYLFVYTADGHSAFHATNAELVGRDLSQLRDFNGKPMVQHMLDVARRPERDASGWIFYLWAEQWEFQPRWKASYIRKAVAPDGRVYAVGSGSGQLKTEKAWVKERVDLAAELIVRKGREAVFSEIRDPASKFHFLDCYIFVTDMEGHALLDPSFPARAGRDLARFRDAAGRPIVQEIIAKLGKSDEAWAQYLWPKSGETVPSRKALYARRVSVGGETLYVGSDFFLPSPVWMKQ